MHKWVPNTYSLGSKWLKVACMLVLCSCVVVPVYILMHKWVPNG